MTTTCGHHCSWLNLNDNWLAFFMVVQKKTVQSGLHLNKCLKIHVHVNVNNTIDSCILCSANFIEGMQIAPVGGHMTLILRTLRCRGRETGMQWWSKRREMTWASSITKALMFDENMNDMNKKYLWTSCRTLDGLIFSLSWGSLLVDINETKIPCTSHICVLLWYSFFARSNARVRT